MTQLTIDQASALTGVSRDTIRRRLRAGHLPNATRGPAVGGREPAWLIPLADLAAAGLPLRTHPGDNRPGGTRLDGEGRGGGPTAGSDRLVERLAHSEALTAAQQAHIADLRTEISRLHQIIADLTRALAPQRT